MQDHWFSEEQATFGDRLSGAREAAQLTQRQLAEKLGVKLKTLSAWEQDLTEPRANKLQMVAGVLGVSVGWLLTGDGEGLTEPASQSVIPPKISEILTEIRAVRIQIRENTERLAQLEKQLRAGLKDKI